MVFQYSHNLESDEPIVLINKHIGFDEEDGMGIDDAQLQSELFELDTMGKKRIKMFINSPGGLVIGGYNIIGAMQQTKTPIDTYCVGICASIAGIIFQCGRKRYMADYGILMYHNPYAASGAYSPLVENMRKSLNKIMCEKTGMTEDAVKSLMDRTSYISAEDSIKMNLCDVVEQSVSMNTKYYPKNELEVKEAYTHFEKVLNKIFTNTKSIKMLKVANKLKLNEAANEDQIVEAITSIENRAVTAETELTEIKNKLTEKETAIGKVSAELEDVKNKLTDAQTQIDGFKAEKEKAELEVKKSNAKNLISEAVRLGKIKNEAALLNTWVTKATEDFDGTKGLLEAIPATKKSEAIKIQNQDQKPEYTTVAHDMVAIQNKIEQA